MRWRHPFFTVIFTIILLFCLAQPGQGTSPRKVTILLLDRVSLGELATEAGPFLKAKIGESALALITTNTAGTRSAGNTHATLGAGTPALSDRLGGLALNFDEKWMGIEAGLLYQQLSGDPNFPVGKVILPRLPEAVRLNFSPVRTAVPCLLGQALRKNHLRTAVIGNADLAPPEKENPYFTYSRFAPWLAADQRGLVDYGDVGPSTLQPGTGLLPWETDYRYLLAKYREFREEADLIVLELGDFARLDALASYLFDRQIMAEKRRLFARLDHFAQSIWPLFAGEGHTVILLSPTPSLTNLKQGAYLTPCLVWGKDFPAGFLTSPTTRRPGLVANVDLAPTILSLFHLATPAQVTGRTMTAGEEGDLSTLLQFEAKINTISLFRRKALPVFLNGAAFCLPLSLLLIAFLKLPALRAAGSVRTYLWLFILFLSALPLALHLASQLPLTTIPAFVGTTLAIALSLTFLSGLIGPRQQGRTKTMQLSAVTTAAPLLPLLLLAVLVPVGSGGQPVLLSSSVLGHDPMLGARFYGIGNELAGLFLGSLLGAVLWLYQPNRTRWYRWALGLFLVVVFLLATPRLGANFGAGLTAMAITMTFALYYRQPKTTLRRQILFFLFTLVLFAVALLVFDYLFTSPEQHSHFGLLLETFKNRGRVFLGEIIRRKLRVNLRLLGTRWTFLFLSASLTATAGFLGSKRVLPPPALAAAFIGGSIGFFCNDSGLVFAALFFYPLATTALLLLLAKARSGQKK